MQLSSEQRQALEAISSATVTTVLLKKGLRRVWMRGPRPMREGMARLVGPAFTMRFIPAREDLATPQAWASPMSTRAAVEAMPEGCVAVVDAMGVADAGIFGDILCERMVRRGVLGLVTDGAMRDIPGVLATGLPVWCQGAAAPPAVSALNFVDWQQPVACGGVAVYPGDIVIADADGAVLMPIAMLDEVIAAAKEQEALDAWVMSKVQQGASLPGLYPPNEENLALYGAQRDA